MLRDSPPPDLTAFDLPEGRDVAGQRESSTRASQALFVLNSPLVVEQARALADGFDADASREERVATAYQRVLQRDPDASELARALGHIDAQLAELSGADAGSRAWASLCQALLASSEFRYVD
jgi:hypothetical protein